MGWLSSIGRAISEGARNIVDSVKDAGQKCKEFIEEKVEQGKTFIRNLFDKKSKDLGKTESYDKDCSTVDQTAENGKMLAGYSLGIEQQADMIEKNCLEESQKYFNRLIGELNRSDSGFNTSNIEAALGDVKSKINGFLKNHVAKRLSLDDSECEKVLYMNAGKEKENAMKRFSDHVMNEALEMLSAQICEIVEKQNSKIKEHLEDVLKKKEKEYSSMLKQFETIAEESSNKMANTEKMKVKPMLVMGITEIILSELAE